MPKRRSTAKDDQIVCLSIDGLNDEIRGFQERVSGVENALVSVRSRRKRLALERSEIQTKLDALEAEEKAASLKEAQLEQKKQKASGILESEAAAFFQRLVPKIIETATRQQGNAESDAEEPPENSGQPSEPTVEDLHTECDAAPHQEQLSEPPAATPNGRAAAVDTPHTPAAADGPQDTVDTEGASPSPSFPHSPVANGKVTDIESDGAPGKTAIPNEDKVQDDTTPSDQDEPDTPGSPGIDELIDVENPSINRKRIGKSSSPLPSNNDTAAIEIVDDDDADPDLQGIEIDDTRTGASARETPPPTADTAADIEVTSPADVLDMEDDPTHSQGAKLRRLAEEDSQNIDKWMALVHWTFDNTGPNERVNAAAKVLCDALEFENADNRRSERLWKEYLAVWVPSSEEKYFDAVVSNATKFVPGLSWYNFAKDIEKKAEHQGIPRYFEEWRKAGKA